MTDKPLEDEAQLHERGAVDEELEETAMHEHRRQQPPPFSVGRAWSEARAPRDERVVVGTAPAHAEKDEDVDGDQHRHHEWPRCPLTQRITKWFGLGAPAGGFLPGTFGRGHDSLFQLRALVGAHRVEGVAAEHQDHEEDHHEDTTVAG